MRSAIGGICFVVVLLILIAGCVNSPPGAPNGTPTVSVGPSGSMAAGPSPTSTLAAIGTSVAPTTSTSTPTAVPASKTSTNVQPLTSSMVTVSSNALISFVEVPRLGADSPLKGTVNFQDTGRYKVIVYIKVDNGWWGPKPYWDNPKTDINADGSWTTDIVTGGNDAQATEIVAFLIPASFSPPNMKGDENLPVGLDQCPKVHATR